MNPDRLRVLGRFAADFASRFFAAFLGTFLTGLLLLIGIYFIASWRMSAAVDSFRAQQQILQKK